MCLSLLSFLQIASDWDTFSNIQIIILVSKLYTYPIPLTKLLVTIAVEINCKQIKVFLECFSMWIVCRQTPSIPAKQLWSRCALECIGIGFFFFFFDILVLFFTISNYCLWLKLNPYLHNSVRQVFSIMGKSNFCNRERTIWKSKP